MRTVSLRRRTVLCTMAVLAALLVAVGGFVDVSLGARLRDDLRTRLLDRAALAEQLAPTLSGQQLVDRLSTSGVSATLVSEQSGVVVGRPQPERPPTPPRLVPPPGAPGPAGAASQPGRGLLPRAAPTSIGAGSGPRLSPGVTAATPSPGPGGVTEIGDLLVLREPLAGGNTLLLATSSAPVRDAQQRFRLFMAIGGGAGLVLAVLLLHLLLGRALLPLDVMTRLARDIAAGDRGQRLRPDRTDTELGRIAAALDAMLEELEGAAGRAQAAEARLRAFVSDASHELRTPLAAVSAGAEALLLQGDGNRAEQERLAAAVVREARRSSRLVEDLLTVSRLAESFPLSLTTVDLVGVAALAAIRARLLDPDLTVCVHGAASCLLVGDAVRLEQLLTNLLDNARRAAPAGRVCIDVTCADSTAQVEVTDSGLGVPPGDRERIFDRLVRLDAARSGAAGGAGLGLSIARGLARVHGGDLVCLAPRPGGLAGARFVLTLPRGAPDQGSVLPGADPGGPDPADRPTH